MEVMIQNPKYLFLFWAVLAVALLVAAGLFIRRRNIRRFVAVESQSAIWPGGIGRRWPALSAALFITAMLAVVLGLADVRWGQTWTEVPQRGIDIVFALDVSRSMLARDVSPDRLTRAKEYIRDILAQMGGDRVGLVIFAGRPRQVLPLTSDYDEALAVLEDISPQSLSRGGSLIGDAIRAAAGCFSDKTPDHKAIVVLTDGEDQDSYPVMAARRAFKERGIRVYTVGLGDSRLGGRIPVRTTKAGTIYLKHKGQIVWSKMNGKLLRQIALAGGGAYIPAGTSQADMAGVYRKYIRAIHQREFRQGRVMHYIPRYRWFVGPAAILLMIELLLSGGSVRRQGGTGGFFSAVGKGLGRLRSNRTSAGIVFVALAAILLSPGSLRAKESSAGELTHRGNIALKAGRPAEAMEAYKQAIKLLGDEKRYRAQLSYNQALALYRQGKYDQAQASLRGAMGEADRWLEARARYNMGNCLYASALPLSKKNKTQAIKQLQQAIKQYRKALAINADDVDSRANIELAQKLIDKLKKQEHQQKKKDQQKKQQKQKQQEQKQKQKEQSPEQQKKKQQKPNPDKQQKNQKNQEKQKNKKSEQKKNKQEQPRENQSPKTSQPKPKTQPDGRQKKGQNKDKAPRPRMQPPGGKQRKMSKEEAARLLQAVRDKNLKRRKEKTRKIKAVAPPVEKDW